MTARENVEVSLDLSGKTKINTKERAYESLERVGINRGEADSLVQKLSGGQQQRVAIARCLAGDVPIIVADEPTGNLDSKNAAIVFDLFKHLTTEFNQTVLAVTHDNDFARASDRIIEMADGIIL